MTLTPLAAHTCAEESHAAMSHVRVGVAASRVAPPASCEPLGALIHRWVPATVVRVTGSVASSTPTTPITISPDSASVTVTPTLPSDVPEASVGVPTPLAPLNTTAPEVMTEVTPDIVTITLAVVCVVLSSCHCSTRTFPLVCPLPVMNVALSLPLNTTLLTVRPSNGPECVMATSRLRSEPAATARLNVCEETLVWRPAVAVALKVTAMLVLPHGKLEEHQSFPGTGNAR